MRSFMSFVAAYGSLLAAATVATAALMPGYASVDDIHLDLAMPLDRVDVHDPGAWRPHIHTGSYGVNGWNNYAPNAAVLVVNSSTYTQRPTTGNLSTPAYNFLGVAPGEPYYRLQQTLAPGQLYLGVEGDYSGIPASGNAAPFPTRMLSSNATNWGSWDPDGAGGTAYGNTGNGRWIEIALKAVRYDANPNATAATLDAAAQGAYFSAWAFGSFSELNLKLANQDGIDSADEFHEIIRSHSHYNWAFSKAGFYEVDLQARTFLGTGGGAGVAGAESISPVATFHFTVQPIPEPASLAIVGLGAATLLASRRRDHSNTNVSM